MPNFITDFLASVAPTAPSTSSGRTTTVRDDIARTLALGAEAERNRREKALPTFESAIPQPVGAPNRTGEAARRAFGASLVKGLIYPVSGLLSDLYRDVNAIAVGNKDLLASEIQRTGLAENDVYGVAAGAPNAIGELVGAAVPFVGTYGKFAQAAQVAKAENFMQYAARGAAASTAQSVALGLGTYLEDGESRAGRVARDAAINGVFEIVGLPFLRRAWYDELGTKAAGKAADVLSRVRGTSLEDASSAIDALRAGQNMDPGVAETVLRELGATDKTAANTPLGHNAKRVLDGWLQNVIPDNVRVDAALAEANPNFGIQFTIRERGAAPRVVTINSVKGDKNMTATGKDVSTTSWAQQMNQVREEIFLKRAQAMNDPNMDTGIRISDIQVADMRAFRRFRNYMHGYAKSGAPPLPADKIGEAIGAAPHGTIGETGDLAKAAPGQKVVIKKKGQAPREATVVKGPGKATATAAPAKPDTLTAGQFSSILAKGLGESGPIAQSKEEYNRLMHEFTTRGGTVDAAAEVLDLHKQGRFVSPKEATVSAPTFGASPEALESSAKPYFVRQLREAKNKMLSQTGEKTAPGMYEYGDLVRQAKKVADQDVTVRIHERNTLAARQAQRTDATIPARQAQNEAEVERAAAGDLDLAERELPGQTIDPAAWEGHATVTYVDDFGKTRTEKVALNELMAQYNVSELSGKPRPRFQISAHPSGEARRGIITLGDAPQVEIEGIGTPTEYYRSELFRDIDPEDTSVGMSVRFFANADGHLTFSVPQHTLHSVPQSFGMKQDVGMWDSIRGLVHIPTGQSVNPAEYIRRQRGWVRMQKDWEKSPSGQFSKVWNVVEGFHAEGDTSFRGMPGNPPPRLITIDPKTGGLVWTRRQHKETGELGAPTARRTPKGGKVTIRPDWRDRPDAAVATREPAAGYSPGSKYYSPGRTDDQVHSVPSVRYTSDAEETLTGEFAGVGKTVHGERQLRNTGREHLLPPDVQLLEPTPELMAARKAAQALLKRGVSPDTKLSIFVAQHTHRNVRGQEGYNWTLGALADYVPSSVSHRLLTDEASFRGYQYVFANGKHQMVSTDGTRTFDTSAEALEYVVREGRNDPQYVPKLEQEAERLMGLGFERTFDADVDGGYFRSKKLQESGVTDVLAGVKPGTVIYSRVKEGDKSIVPKAIEDMSRSKGRPDMAVIRTIDLGPVENHPIPGTHQFFVYNSVQLNHTITRMKAALAHHGVDLRPMPLQLKAAELLKADASRKPGPALYEELAVRAINDAFPKHGLAMFYGRDPEQALLYSVWRKYGFKEQWQTGRVTADSSGAYRSWTPQQMQELRAGPTLYGVKGGAPDPDMPAMDGPFNGLDMADEIPAPFEGFAPGSVFPHPPGADEEMFEHLLSDNRPTNFYPDTFRIPMELFKEIETHVGVPMYRWWLGIEKASTDVETATKAAYGELGRLARTMRKDDRKLVQMLLEAKYSEGYDELAKSAAPEHLKAVEGLEKVWRNFWETNVEGNKEFETTFEEFMGNFPAVRLHAEEVHVNATGRLAVPSPLSYLKSNLFTRSAIHESQRDYDFSSVAMRTMRGIANDLYMKETWNDVAKQLEHFKDFGVKQSDQSAVNGYFEQFNRYRFEKLHGADAWQRRLSGAFNKITKTLMGKELDPTESFDLVSTMTSTNYYANLAFNLGATTRNYMQTLQTVYPMVGGRATYHGIREALKWRKSKELQALMEAKGVVQRDAFVEPFRDLQRFIMETKAGQKGGQASAKVLDFLDKGIQFYQSADSFNKVAAFKAKELVAVEAGEKYVAGKITWKEFLEHSGAEMQDAADNGPLLTLVRETLAEGNVKGAANALALDFAQQTQFVYSRGNAPYIMQSTLGRLFGQYGTWPSWFAEWMHSAVTRGSYQSRLKVMSRWAAMNGAVYYGMANAFGVDFSRWSFFAPLSYSGGPFFQIAQQGISVASATFSGDEDPVARINAERLKFSAAKQLTPLPLNAIKTGRDAISQMWDAQPADAMRTIFGLPKKE